MKFFTLLTLLTGNLFLYYNAYSQTINLSQSISDGTMEDVVDPDSLEEIVKDIKIPEETELDKGLKTPEELKKEYGNDGNDKNKKKKIRKSYMEIRKEKERQRKAEMEQQIKAEREARKSYRNSVQDLNDISKTFRGDNYRVSY